MAQKTKTREITIVDKGGAFNTFFRKLTGEEREYDFEGLSALRKLLSNERARLLHAIKVKHPKSLYELAKLVGRDFKSVQEDMHLLERFGFIEMVAEKTGKRRRLKPNIVVDTITIHIKI
ncbi:MAG TPA: ArsR family transcriptional regulator [Candidatus Nanoarchaeia archaeon]|nr:ArsR family transcriptional regulator [Candidatus Nanoarchaeia archaeon]